MIVACRAHVHPKNSYGMSVTTLDEVFLRVAEGTADFADRKHLLDANGNGGEQIMTRTMQRDESLSSSMMSSSMKAEPNKVDSEKDFSVLGFDGIYCSDKSTKLAWP